MHLCDTFSLFNFRRGEPKSVDFMYVSGRKCRLLTTLLEAVAGRTRRMLNMDACKKSALGRRQLLPPIDSRRTNDGTEEQWLFCCCGFAFAFRFACFRSLNRCQLARSSSSAGGSLYYTLSDPATTLHIIIRSRSAVISTSWVVDTHLFKLGDISAARL